MKHTVKPKLMLLAIMAAYSMPQMLSAAEEIKVDKLKW